MRRIRIIACMALMSLITTTAWAERLELGLAVTPSWVHDRDFIDITGSPADVRVGLDIRSEVASLRGFKLLPLLGYRFHNAYGDLSSYLDADFNLHDFYLGLRVRKGLLSWLGLFLEAKGGVVYASMESFLQTYNYDYSAPQELDSRDRYEDTMVTWSVGGLFGLEVYLSRAWLRSRGVRRFCFGGELAGGYIGRGTLDIDPTLEGGAMDAIDAETVGDWGDLNPSGFELQLAASFFFF